MDVPIINSIDNSVLHKGLSSVSERYYEHKYCNELPGVSDLRHRVSFHTNKICMLSLADNHPIVRDRLVVKGINFMSGGTDRLKNVASGKGKRGAQKLQVDSKICQIETDDATFTVYSCMKGKLIEINESLIKSPNLLVEKPISEGFIALMLPVFDNYAACKERMLTKDEYLAIYNGN